MCTCTYVHFDFVARTHFHFYIAVCTWSAGTHSDFFLLEIIFILLVFRTFCSISVFQIFPCFLQKSSQNQQVPPLFLLSGFFPAPSADGSGPPQATPSGQRLCCIQVLRAITAPRNAACPPAGIPSELSLPGVPRPVRTPAAMPLQGTDFEYPGPVGLCASPVLCQKISYFREIS